MNSEIGHGAYDDRDFRARLALIIGAEEPYVWAKRVGIPSATFARVWTQGVAPKAPHLKRIREVTGVSIDWLLTGEGPMRTDEAGSAVVPFPIGPQKEVPPALDRPLLEQVISQVEEWLENNGRVLPPHQKSIVFTELYEMAVEDCTEGEATSDPKKVGRILRLMTR